MHARNHTSSNSDLKSFFFIPSDVTEMLEIGGHSDVFFSQLRPFGLLIPLLGLFVEYVVVLFRVRELPDA